MLASTDGRTSGWLSLPDLLRYSRCLLLVFGGIAVCYCSYIDLIASFFRALYVLASTSRNAGATLSPTSPMASYGQSIACLLDKSLGWSEDARIWA